MKRYLKQFIHNVIVHPLMMFLPVNIANELHDRNADWAFGLDRYDDLKCYPSIDVITTEDVFLLEDGLLPNLLTKYNKQLSKEELINFYTGYFNWTVGNK